VRTTLSTTFNISDSRSRFAEKIKLDLNQQHYFTCLKNKPNMFTCLTTPNNLFWGFEKRTFNILPRILRLGHILNSNTLIWVLILKAY